MRTRLRLRSPEWVLVSFFLYVAVLSLWFHPLSGFRLLPLCVLGAALFAIVTLALGERFGPGRFSNYAFSYARDWLPLGLTLTAYREMDWFTPGRYDYHLEKVWVGWDRWLLDDCGIRRLFESAGWLLPGYFELCYLLVYAVAPVTIVMVYACGRRDLVDRVLVLYLAGTLLAYALFPYFPSAPPRTVFPDADLPRVVTPLRLLNLWLLGGYGIHSSVFPSAHVSSAFAAAWAVLVYLPGNKWLGRGMLIYAISVTISTVYGRYHYAADAGAGMVVSDIAVTLTSPSYVRTLRSRRLRGLL